MNKLRRFSPDISIGLLLLLVPLAFFWQQTLGGKTMVPADNLFQYPPYTSLADEYDVGVPHNALLSDLVLQNTPWKQFAREQIQQGEIPLWQPNILAGTPFLAAGQHSVLYPPSALFLIMPIPAAFGWFAVLHLWIAGLAMYAFTRTLGIGRAGSMVAGLIYQMSGFALASVVFPMIIATMCWLPLLLTSIELVIRQKAALGGRPATLPWVGAGAITLGLAALAGHAEALYFTLLVMAFYATWRLTSTLIKERHRWRFIIGRGVWLLAMVGLGLAFGAIQLLPAVQLVQSSFREGSEPFSQILSYAFPNRHVLAFLMPNVFGNPTHHSYLDVFTLQWMPITENTTGSPINNTFWGIKNYVEGAAYIGILALVLAGVALADGVLNWRETDDQRLLFTVLGGLSLTFIFGLPTYALLYYGLPFINQSHAPFRWVWPLTLCIAVLAAYGVDALRHPRDRTQPVIRWAGWGAVAGSVLLMAGLLGSRMFYGAIEGLVERVFMGLSLAPLAFPSTRAFYSYQFWNVALLALMLGLAGGVLLLSRREWSVRVRDVGRAPLWVLAAAAVVVADLAVASWGFYPAVDPALLEVTPEPIQWLKDQQTEVDPWRFMAFEPEGGDVMNSNIGWLHGLEEASGYDSLIPGQYADYMRVIHPQTDLPFNRIAPIYIYDTLEVAPALDLLNVRYFVTYSYIEFPGYEVAYDNGDIRIYENVNAMPRAFTLPLTAEQTYTGDFAEAAEEVDVRRHVLVNEACAAGDGTGQPADHTAVPIARRTANDVEMLVTVEEPSWLVVTSSYYPGWRAFISEVEGGPEQEIELCQVNGNFRGVLLEPGEWSVRMSYSPDVMRVGGFISFMAGMLTIFVGGVYLWRTFYRESEEGSTAQRVAKNSVTPIVLNLFNRGIQFAFALIYLRVLGPAGAGRYQYAVLIFGWFDILSNFGMDTLVMREVSRDKDAANKWLMNTTLLRLALALLGIPILMAFISLRQALPTSTPLAQETITAIWLLYGGLFFSTINKGLTGVFYAYEKAEYPSAVQTISTMLVATLGLVALLLGTGIVGLAAVSIIVNVITFIILTVLTVRLFFMPRLTFDFGLQREAVSESFPLMLNHLLATLFFRIDVILLEALTTDIVVGWYGAVYKWIDAINVIPAFFTQALFPVMSRQAAEDRDALRRNYLFSIKLMTFISVPGAVVTTLLAYVLMGILGGEEFLPYSAIALQIFVWSIPIGWINSVTNYLIIALDKQRILTWAFVFGAGFNIAANLYFIPRYSFIAAAVVTILSEFVLLAFFYMVLIEPLGRINWARLLGRIAAAGTLMAITAWFVGQQSVWAGVVASVVVYIVAIWALRPFDGDEVEKLASLLPANLRPWMLRVIQPSNTSA